MIVVAGMMWTVAVAVTISAPANASATGAAGPRHAVVMLIDDLGYGDVSYAGAEFPTQTIDELARDGIRLNQSYVTQLCSPTRASSRSRRTTITTSA